MWPNRFADFSRTEHFCELVYPFGIRVSNNPVTIAERCFPVRILLAASLNLYPFFSSHVKSIG